MAYIAEGFEEQAARVVKDQLRMRVNSVRNAVRVGKSSPSIWSQADVRKAGHELNGSIDLACNVLGNMGQMLDPREIVLARQVARDAIAFKYNRRSA